MSKTSWISVRGILGCAFAAVLFSQFVQAQPQEQAESSSWFLMTSHKEPQQTNGLHLAVSQGGLDWQVINNDESVMKPAVGEVFRDPSIARDESGRYHLVWTISWGCGKYKGVGYAGSTDLIEWSEQRIIPVMESYEKTDFVWAPELFHDTKKNEWMIHLSSSVQGIFPETLDLFDGRANPRIYYCLTKDFKTFSPSKLLFNADCLAIDSYLYRGGDDLYYLFFKADRRTEPKRGILMASSHSPEGPYSVDPNMITSPQEGWAEGPSAMKIGEKTRLYYACQNYSSAYESADMEKWTSIRDAINPPGGYRHGTVIRIPEADANRLMNHKYDNESEKGKR